MYLLVIFVLTICVIALMYHLRKALREQVEVEERASTHFLRAEKYFKDTERIQQIRKILNSDLLCYDKIKKIELVCNLENEN